MKFVFVLFSLMVLVGCNSKESKTTNDNVEMKTEAEEVKTEKANNDVFKTEMCKHIEKQAETIMHNRQYNLPMSEAVTYLDQLEEGAIKELMRNMIVRAYNIPNYNSETHQQKAINDFKNEYFQECYTSLLLDN